MFVTNKHDTFTYGGDIKKFRNGHQELEKALKEYNECVLHQMGCAGYFDE